MTREQMLREKLRKIGALFAGATTEGERVAAGAAAERIRRRVGAAAGDETVVENNFSIPDAWSRQLFVALCRRHNLHPFRYRRMHRQSIIVKAPDSFIQKALWPDLNPIEMAFSKLKALLCKAAERNVEDLWQRIGKLIEYFSPQECQNYFRHAGYGST